MADLSGPPTTPPQVRIRATSPPATPAPKQVKWVKGFSWDIPAEPGDGFARKIELTAEKLDKQWPAVMEKEAERYSVMRQQVLVLEAELQEVEEKLATKLEDAVEEIGLLKKEKEEGMAAANEKLAAVSVECKGRGKEIATLRVAVANTHNGKRDEKVEKDVQTEVMEVLAQNECRTYTSILAQTEGVSIEG